MQKVVFKMLDKLECTLWVVKPGLSLCLVQVHLRRLKPTRESPGEMNFWGICSISNATRKNWHEHFCQLVCLF